MLWLHPLLNDGEIGDRLQAVLRGETRHFLRRQRSAREARPSGRVLLVRGGGWGVALSGVCYLAFQLAQPAVGVGKSLRCTAFVAAAFGEGVAGNGRCRRRGVIMCALLVLGALVLPCNQAFLLGSEIIDFPNFMIQGALAV